MSGALCPSNFSSLTICLLTSFPLRAEVEGHNNSRLDELTGNAHIYHSMDSRGYNAKGELVEKEMAQRLLERLVAPRSLSLKVTHYFRSHLFIDRLNRST